MNQGGSSLSGWAITGIVLGCVLCVYGSWICIKIEQQQHSINQHRINNSQTEKKEPEPKPYLYREPHGYPSNIIIIPPNMNDQPRIIDVQDPPSYHCPDKHECPDPPAYEEGQPSVPDCDSGGGEGNSD